MINPLSSRLKRRSFEAMDILFVQVLSCTGFDDVRQQGRHTQKQKSKRGGFEYECRTTIGGLFGRVLVKVLRDDVRRRNADEMVGVLAREGADRGLIITTENITRDLLADADAYRARGVECWDGLKLLKVMRKYGIAHFPNGEFDYSYLEELEKGAATIRRIRKELRV